MTVAELARLPAGTELGATPWRAIGQEEVDRFAELTGDRNPIHVDSEYARRTRFGGTIVHGYLTLAMLAPAFGELLEVRDASISLNYGLDRVRFPAPLPVGEKHRVVGLLRRVAAIDDGVQVEMELSVEVPRRERPALVAVCLSRFYA